jgi:hypothetical protein
MRNSGHWYTYVSLAAERGGLPSLGSGGGELLLGEETRPTEDVVLGGLDVGGRVEEGVDGSTRVATLGDVVADGLDGGANLSRGKRIVRVGHGSRLLADGRGRVGGGIAGGDHCWSGGGRVEWSGEELREERKLWLWRK